MTESTEFDYLQEVQLPHATVCRIARHGVENVRFQRQSLQAINKATALFITFVTDAALEIAQSHKR
jgi:histone H3/H4